MKTHKIKGTLGKETREYTVEGPHETREDAIKHLESVVPGIKIESDEAAASEATPAPVAKTSIAETPAEGAKE